MKVLFLNAWDHEGGAARAAFRLHDGVQEAGVDARMLVKKKTSADPSVIGPRSRMDRAMAWLRPILEHRRITRYPGWNRLTFSPALYPDRLVRQVEAIGPDLVHLHWMGDAFLQVETLPRLGRPVLWTMHDSWPFTGGCHVPFACTRYRQSCGACPALGSAREEDLSRRVWRRKRKAWGNLDLTLVSPSRWLADCARSSSLFGDSRIEVIPNGLNLERYRPVDRNVAREALGLPKDRKLILFGGVSGTSDPNKGFHLLTGALHRLAAEGWGSRAELLVFGAGKPAAPADLGMEATYLGWLHDDLSIRLLYAAADVFILPSVQENLPNTILESMACGTPAVAFRQGGVPDLIDHEDNGYLAEPFEPDDLARGISWVLEDEDRRRTLGRQARQKVERNFSLEKVAKQYVALYGELSAEVKK